MNDLLATIFTGIIIDENEKNYFVQKNGQTFGLSKSEGEHKIGEAVEGFGYQNQKHENGSLHKFQKVASVTMHLESLLLHERFRAFVDIGLPDKDFVVSLDELPTMTELWPKKEIV